MPGPMRNSFMRHWWAVEAIPIYVVVGAVMVGGSWYLARLARGPHIIWTKSNPTPWNDVKQDENVKMMAVNQKFERSWTRDRL